MKISLQTLKFLHEITLKFLLYRANPVLQKEKFFLSCKPFVLSCKLQTHLLSCKPSTPEGRKSSPFVQAFLCPLVQTLTRRQYCANPLQKFFFSCKPSIVNPRQIQILRANQIFHFFKWLTTCSAEPGKQGVEGGNNPLSKTPLAASPPSLDPTPTASSAPKSSNSNTFSGLCFSSL